MYIFFVRNCPVPVEVFCISKVHLFYTERDNGKHEMTYEVTESSSSHVRKECAGKRRSRSWHFASCRTTFDLLLLSSLSVPGLAEKIDSFAKKHFLCFCGIFAVSIRFCKTSRTCCSDAKEILLRFLHRNFEIMQARKKIVVIFKSYEPNKEEII